MMRTNKPEENHEILSPLHQMLELKNICPNWSFKLRSGLDEKDVKILVHDSKNCIVGEAWGYTGRHAGYYIAPLIPFVGCWECVRLGRDMGKIAKESGHLAAPTQLGPTIYQFVRHWNSKHSATSEKSRHAKVRKKLPLIFQKK
jgi:hypothetical protein